MAFHPMTSEPLVLPSQEVQAAWQAQEALLPEAVPEVMAQVVAAQQLQLQTLVVVAMPFALESIGRTCLPQAQLV